MQDFFVSDSNSIECADKKALKSSFGKHRIKKRKRYLKGSLGDLYISYCETAESPLAYSKICAFKPFNVVYKNLKETPFCAHSVKIWNC